MNALTTEERYILRRIAQSQNREPTCASETDTVLSRVCRTANDPVTVDNLRFKGMVILTGLGTVGLTDKGMDEYRILQARFV